MSFQFFQSSVTDSPVIEIPAIGVEVTVRLSSNISGNALTILETVNAPGFGPPKHRHPETEVFRILEGRYLYEVDGKRFEAAEGDVVSVPGGAAHAFVNICDKPGRQIVLMVPGMDATKFFTELGDLFAAGRPTPEALNEFGKSWSMEFLGSPLRPTANRLSVS